MVEQGQLVPLLDAQKRPLFEHRPQLIFAFGQSHAKGDNAWAWWNVSKERSVFEYIVFSSFRCTTKIVAEDKLCCHEVSLGQAMETRMRV